MVQSLNIFILKISIIACLKNIVYLRKKNQLCSYMKKKFISYNKIYSVLLESKGGWLVACVAFFSAFEHMRKCASGWLPIQTRKGLLCAFLGSFLQGNICYWLLRQRVLTGMSLILSFGVGLFYFCKMLFSFFYDYYYWKFL